jgi:hypothetical protein
MANIMVTIRYFLSEQGRRESLRQGGDGRRIQEVTGVGVDADLDAFTVNDDGEVSFDLTDLHGCDPDFNPRILPPASKGRFQKGEILWDVVPGWDDLLVVVRGFKAELDEIDAYYREHQNQLEAIAREFLNDPTARPEQLNRESVKIKGESFYGDHPVVAEAKQRAANDLEELKKTNRAMLREWIIRNGTDNQRERLAAELLPWKEAFETAEEHYFKPLEGFPLYRRFEPAEVLCVCEQQGGFRCEPKFQSFDATELTADEWEQFARIKSAVPGGTFQFREHRAKCATAPEPEIRRGVIVKFTLGQLIFKREFAVTTTSDVEVPF